MQPYIFPYIGYFQLLYASDVFILYDDVDYIKQGWINRNKIWVNRKPQTFTVPLRSVSSYRSIRDTEIHTDLYPKWRKKFLKTITQSYGKSPNFEEVYSLIKGVVTEIPPKSIAEMSGNSILKTSSFLGNRSEIVFSSMRHSSSVLLSRTQRLIEISKSEKADTYLNSEDGKQLYHPEDFEKTGIELRFLQYREAPFIEKTNLREHLSIIHLLMNYSVKEINTLISDYQFCKL